MNNYNELTKVGLIKQAFPTGTLTDAALREIQKAINAYAVRDEKYAARLVYPNIREMAMINPDWEQWIISKGEYAGTFPKRYQNFCYKQYGMRVPDKLLSEIGNIASRHANGQANIFYMRFVDSCDWNPGDFNESDSSCWWSDYNGARIGLFENGGMALQLFESEEAYYCNSYCGIGRAWIYFDESCPENLIVFNAYGASGHPLLTYTRLIATYLGLSYKQISYTAHHAWINGDSAYLIGNPESISGITSINSDFDNPDAQEDDNLYCSNCGDEVDEDDCQFYDGDPYCDSCFSDRFFECQHCGNVYTQRNGLMDSVGDWFCQSCYGDLYDRCSECGDEISEDEVVRNDNGDAYCSSCYNDLYDRCPVCTGEFEIGSAINNCCCHVCAEKYAGVDSL